MGKPPIAEISFRRAQGESHGKDGPCRERRRQGLGAPMKFRRGSAVFAAASAGIMSVLIMTPRPLPARAAAFRHVPMIMDLDPRTIAAGSPSFTLTVKGSFFARDAAV